MRSTDVRCEWAMVILLPDVNTSWRIWPAHRWTWSWGMQETEAEPWGIVCALDQTRPETSPTPVSQDLAFVSLNIKYLNCVTLRASKLLHFTVRRWKLSEVNVFSKFQLVGTSSTPQVAASRFQPQLCLFLLHVTIKCIDINLTQRRACCRWDSILC